MDILNIVDKQFIVSTFSANLNRMYPFKKYNFEVVESTYKSDLNNDLIIKERKIKAITINNNVNSKKVEEYDRLEYYTYVNYSKVPNEFKMYIIDKPKKYHVQTFMIKKSPEHATLNNLVVFQYIFTIDKSNKQLKDFIENGNIISPEDIMKMYQS